MKIKIYFIFVLLILLALSVYSQKYIKNGNGVTIMPLATAVGDTGIYWWNKLHGC